MNPKGTVNQFTNKSSLWDSNSRMLLKEQYDRFYRDSDFKYYSEKTTRRFLKALLGKGRVLNGAKILDVGCGTAFYTDQLRALGFNVIGVDISAVGVLKGRTRYPSLSLVVGDSSTMPSRCNSFDVLFMNGCSLANTHDIQTLRSYISYLRQFLKNTGALLLMGQSDFSGGTAANSEWIYHSYDEILKFVDQEKVIADGPYVTNLRLLSSLGRAGLNMVVSWLARVFPGNRKWSFVYYIRKRQD